MAVLNIIVIILCVECFYSWWSGMCRSTGVIIRTGLRWVGVDAAMVWRCSWKERSCRLRVRACHTVSSHMSHVSSTRVIPKVSGLDILVNNTFHNLYISEMYILYELSWASCRYDVIV